MEVGVDDDDQGVGYTNARERERVYNAVKVVMQNGVWVVYTP